MGLIIHTQLYTAEQAGANKITEINLLPFRYKPKTGFEGKI